MSAQTPEYPCGPILFAYDGSELADLAIDEAGRLLGGQRDALVVCVWQPFDVGFVPRDGTSFNAQQIPEVKRAAERTAEIGVARAEAAGFRARPLAVESSPTWKGICEVAETHDACVIVIGSHTHSRLGGVLVGSIASAVGSHSHRTLLVTHRHN